ncbi:MAG: hypothetical protein M3304_02775 [Actinomycetota bacterium]|nr:hypothetical protein [Actinomycetota bacterium]
MKRRLLSLLGAFAVLAAAPQAIADQPLREGLPAEPFTLDASICGFPVDVTFPTNREFITTFSSGKQIVTGALIAQLTNTETGKSIEINISGPGILTTDESGTTTFMLLGRSLVFFSPGQLGPGSAPELLLTSGPATIVFDENGVVQSFERTSASAQDLCAILADP